MASCLIGLGANLGRPQRTIESAIERLAQSPFQLLAKSRIVCTPPIGPEGQNNYLNTAATVDTDLDPLQVLEALQRIETELGRKRHERWEARTIDLDLLLFDKKIFFSSTDALADAAPQGSWLASPPRLVVPHPWLLVRTFALRPAVEIAPEMIHPISQRCLRDFLRPRAPIVICTVGGESSYRARVVQTAFDRLTVVTDRVNTRVVALDDPNPSVTSCHETPQREQLVADAVGESAVDESAIGAPPRTIFAPFEVFQTSVAAIGVIDPTWMMYRDRSSEFSRAAQDRGWPYVVLSGELEHDVDSLVFAQRSICGSVDEWNSG